MSVRAALLGLIAILFVGPYTASADDATVRSILQNYSNYKYSNIQLLEISGDYSGKLREFFKEETLESGDGGSKNEKLMAILVAIAKSNDGDRARIVDEANSNQEISDMRDAGEVSFDEYNSAIDEAIAISLAAGTDDNNPDAFYLVTTRRTADGPIVYIGLLPVKRVGGAVTANLSAVQFDKAWMLDDIYLVRSLEDKTAADYPTNLKMFNTMIAQSEDQRPRLDEKFSMEQFLNDVVQQGSYRDKTLDLQEIDNMILKRQETGVAKPLEDFRDESKVRATTQEIQSYQRVSAGQPFEYQQKNELIVGFDLISWKRYAPTEAQMSAAYGYFGAETEFKVEDVNGTRMNIETVTVVDEGSPAASAGLEVGDRIVQLNRNEISSNNSNRINTILGDAYPGDVLALTVIKSSGLRENMNIELEADMGANFYANQNLPTAGVELRYGMQEINYPSIWSERATVSYLYGDPTLGDVKLGVILPTGLWSQLADNFATRKFTQSSVGGIATDLNFSTALFKNSGVFNLAFSYVFGDAAQSDFNTQPKDTSELGTTTAPLDYLIRTTARLQYTFAVALDDDFLFRFGLGPTMYVAETWSTERDSTNSETGVRYARTADKTVVDFSGRVEFMSVGGRTPFGASLSYFDRTLGGNLFFQFPIIESQSLVALRLEGQWFWAAMRDPRPWEVETVFIPTARIVWNF